MITRRDLGVSKPVLLRLSPSDIAWLDRRLLPFNMDKHPERAWTELAFSITWNLYLSGHAHGGQLDTSVILAHSNGCIYSQSFMKLRAMHYCSFNGNSINVDSSVQTSL